MSLAVIGAGLPRTGTLSFKLALEQLGFGPCHHMVEVLARPEVAMGWTQAARGEPTDWEAMLRDYHSSCDAPSCMFYATLAETFPDAKIVLTHRDPERWFESTQKTVFSKQLTAALADTPFGPMLEAVIHDRLGDINDHDTLIAAFHRHNAAVIRAIPPERLLVFEVSQGWQPLCDFLGVPIPDAPFPVANSAAEFQLMADAQVKGMAAARAASGASGNAE